MGGNIFGKHLRILTFGESHGPGVGVVIDGLPAGFEIDFEELQKFLDKRKPGQSKITTQRKESDKFEILSGVFEGKTLGTPLAAMIRNQDQRSGDYSHLSQAYRPSHADFTYQEKFGHRDHRGGGRSSARETAARVFAGGICLQYLEAKKIQVRAGVVQVSDIKTETLDWSQVDKNLVRCPNKSKAQEMESFIEKIRKSGDSCGGVIRCEILNAPVGLGEPVFDRFEADLAKAMLSINATKGFEIGSGFEGTKLLGSQHNDLFVKAKNGKIKTKTNNSGGVQGGITNGMPIEFQVAFKPVATVMKDQDSLDSKGNKTVVKGKGRHDPCVLPRAVPIVEAMAALVTFDHYLQNMTSQWKKIMKEIRVAIQGVKGAFHHVAAMDYFAGSKVEPVECLTFLSLCESLKNRDCDIALMAIENSIAGSILPNYSLLEKYQFKVEGEVYLRIEMNLIGAQGTDFKNLLFVESHPMALAQCQDYLARFKSLQMIESADTALSVKRMQTAIPGWAAIGSSLSAELYGLKILASGIETNKQNYTRFLVIQRSDDYKVRSDANKSSLCFQTAHETGALVRSLQIFEKNKVNMTKIQSVPILGRPKSYSFHCDLEWDSLPSYKLAMSEFGKVAENILHFGEYKSGPLPKN